MDDLRRIDLRNNWFVLALVGGAILYPLAGTTNSSLTDFLKPLAVGMIFFGLVGVGVVALAIIVGPFVERDRRNRMLAQLAGALILLAAFILAPWYGDKFPYVTLFKLTIAMQYVMVIVGINLLTGFTGQISLGQGAFFAVGGYTLGIVSFGEWSVPWGISLFMAPVITGVLGFLVGIPALRLKGPYLGLATLALAVTVVPIAKRFDQFTGGVQGITMFGKVNPPGIFSDHLDYFFYYLSLGAAVVMLVISWNIMQGRMGRALIAIRDNETAAASMGINIALYKTTVFGISAAFAGLAGALNAAAIQFVSPDQYSVLVSIRVFVGAIIGGIASIGGAIAGGLFTQFIPDVTSGISRAAPDAIQAAILIVFMFAMRGGFGGFLHETWRYGRKGIRLRKPTAAAPATAERPRPAPAATRD